MRASLRTEPAVEERKREEKLFVVPDQVGRKACPPNLEGTQSFVKNGSGNLQIAGREERAGHAGQGVDVKLNRGKDPLPKTPLRLGTLFERAG